MIFRCFYISFGVLLGCQYIFFCSFSITTTKEFEAVVDVVYEYKGYYTVFLFFLIMKMMSISLQKTNFAVFNTEQITRTDVYKNVVNNGILMSYPVCFPKNLYIYRFQNYDLKYQSITIKRTFLRIALIRYQTIAFGYQTI